MKNFSKELQKLRCLVIEKEDNIRNLTSLLPPNDNSIQFYYCSSYQTALVILANKKFDLIIMSDFNVSENTPDVLAFFQEVRSSFPLILIADEPDFLTKYSFEYDNIIDCLMKPIHLDRLQLALYKFRRYQRAQANVFSETTIFIKIGKSLQKFNIDEIVYIQAMGAISTIVTTFSSHLVNESITHLEQRLPKNKFLRIHKSFIVGLEHVTGFEKKNAILNQTMLPIGLTYREKLQGILSILYT